MAAPKFKQWDKIVVTWNDAYTSLNQFTLTEAMDKNPVKRQSIGYLLTMNDERLIMCGTDDRMGKIKDEIDSEVGDLTVLPRGMVIAIQKLEISNS